MKRISILLVLALLATMLLTACNNGTNEGTGTTTDKPAVSTDPEKDSKDTQKQPDNTTKAPETTEPPETDVPLDPNMPTEVVFGFKSQDDINAIVSHGDSMTYAYDEDMEAMKINFEASSDPIMVLIIPDQAVNMDYFRYMKIRVNAETAGDRMEAFYSSYAVPELCPKSLSTKFQRNQWTDIVFDLTDLDTWTGFLNVLRYDPLMASTPEDYMYIEYIGFFRTMEDLEAYTEYVAPVVTEPAESVAPEA